MKCTDLLTQDHKIILRGIEILEELALRAERHEEIEPADVKAILRFLQVFADDYHQLKEEAALFPALRRTAFGQQPALRHLLFEHDQERSLVAALEESLHTRKGSDFAIFARRLTELLINHMEKEEKVLFGIVERSLTPEEDVQVVEELNKFQSDPSVQADLRHLEFKYLRKTMVS